MCLDCMLVLCAYMHYFPACLAGSNICVGFTTPDPEVEPVLVEFKNQQLRPRLVRDTSVGELG